MKQHYFVLADRKSPFLFSSKMSLLDWESWVGDMTDVLFMCCCHTEDGVGPLTLIYSIYTPFSLLVDLHFDLIFRSTRTSCNTFVCWLSSSSLMRWCSWCADTADALNQDLSTAFCCSFNIRPFPHISISFSIYLPSHFHFLRRMMLGTLAGPLTPIYPPFHCPSPSFSARICLL